MLWVHSSTRSVSASRRTTRPSGRPSPSCGWRSSSCRRRGERPQMTSRIEQYALVGDTQTAALVGDDGSIDWLCVPRFDSGACFAALLGDDSHGRWQIAPAGEVTRTERRYRAGTLVLETDFETTEGSARGIDFRPRGDGPPQGPRGGRGRG